MRPLPFERKLSNNQACDAGIDLQGGDDDGPGAIQRYFEIGLYLLVVTAFATLASTGGLDLPALVVVTLALFVRGYLLAKRRDARFRRNGLRT